MTAVLQNSTIGYRQDIDGLRAVAVLSVVFYHANLGCSGGYVGVDVFFVISGYLITSLLLRDLRESRFSLLEFWERRMRRIFPALGVCVLTTLLGGFFLLLPDDLRKLGESSIAQSLLAANVYFWRTTNYFGGPNTEKPLLHTWSLAVEEQFYVVFPILLLLIFSTRFRKTVGLIGLTLLAFIGSLLLSAWWVESRPFAAFFLLPSRAWELLCGVFVAILPAQAAPKLRTAREVLSWVGLCGILLPVGLYNEYTAFPGFAALPSCLGTALIIWVNTTIPSTQNASHSLVARILSMNWLTFVGKISYSLYLWHWPLIAYYSYWKIDRDSPIERIAVVGLSFLASIASWRFVETPFRTRKICGSRRSVFLMTLCSSAILLVLSGGLVAFQGIPSRIPLSTRNVLVSIKENAELRTSLQNLVGNTDSRAERWNAELPRVGAANPSMPLRFIVLGDSHAGCAAPAFHSLGQKHGIAGTIISYQGIPPLFEWPEQYRRVVKDTNAFWESARDFIRIQGIKHTFLVCCWSSYQSDSSENELIDSLRRSIHEFEKTGTRVWVVLDVPCYDRDVVRTMVRNDMFPRFSKSTELLTELQHKTMNSAVYKLQDAIPTVTFLDPSIQLLDKNDGSYRVSDAGIPLYFDSNHLTIRGAVSVFAPTLEQAFIQMSSESTSAE
jgi:peptidoglycan/LPS O-acetylase OafA/YrhL